MVTGEEQPRKEEEPVSTEIYDKMLTELCGGVNYD